MVKTFKVVNGAGQVFYGETETPAVGLSQHTAYAIIDWFESVYGPLFAVKEEEQA